MGKAAKVSSVDAIVQFRAWLVEYTDRSRQAIVDGQMEVQRIIMWLDNDQLHYWGHQIRVREMRMEEARSEWYRARLGVPEMRTSTASERMAYQKAEVRLKEARQKLDHVKTWRKKLDRELLLYKAHVQQLASSLDADMPKAVAQLDRFIERLQKYVKTTGVPQRELDEVIAEATRALEAVTSEYAGADLSGGMELDRFQRMRSQSPSQAEREASSSDLAPPAALNRGWLSRSDQRRLKEIDLSPAPPGDSDRVVIAADLPEGRIFLSRSSVSEGDSGWYIGPADEDDVLPDRACVAVAVEALLQSRADLAGVMAMPAGTLVVLDIDGVDAVIGPSDEQLWGGVE